MYSSGPRRQGVVPHHSLRILPQLHVVVRHHVRQWWYNLSDIELYSFWRLLSLVVLGVSQRQTLSASRCVGACVCLCLCVCERERVCVRKTETGFVCVCVCACVRERESMRARACVRAYVCAVHTKMTRCVPQEMRRVTRVPVGVSWCIFVFVCAQHVCALCVGGTSRSMCLLLADMLD